MVAACYYLLSIACFAAVQAHFKSLKYNNEADSRRDPGNRCIPRVLAEDACAGMFDGESRGRRDSECQ